MSTSLPDVSFEQLVELARQLTPEQKRILQQQMYAPADDYYSPENVNKRMYERARRWWREHGDLERANLTDAELSDQFWLFDQEGVPRLKSDEGAVEVIPGSLAELAAAAEKMNFHSGEPDIAERSREILETEFTDYLLRRIRGSDAE